MKTCGTCKLEKEDVGKNGLCRQCNTEYMREYRKKNRDKIKKYQQEYDTQYYQDNKEQILEDKKEYYQENREEILQDRKEYYEEHKEEKIEYNKQYYQENKETIFEKDKEYRAKNKFKIRKYHNDYNRNRRLNDPNYRLRTTVSANIGYYLKSNNSSKDGNSCLNYLPYTMDELKNYLEERFESWMIWDDYGKYDTDTWNDNEQSTWTWQIDHIIPQSLLPYTNMADENFKKCWSLDNLRPLNSKQNFLDGVKRVRHNLD